MKKIYLAFLFNISLVFSQNCTIQKNSIQEQYFNIKITDEYRSLEKLDDSTTNWLKCQNENSKNVLSQIKSKDSLSKTFYERVKARKDQTFYLTFKNNDHYFFCKKRVGENYAKLFLKNQQKEEILIYDPKNYKPELGKQFVISFYQPSNKGDKIAIALTEGGKEVSDMIIYDLTTHTLLSDVIENSWPSEMGGISWLPDDSGFIYTKMASNNNNDPDFLLNSESCLHLLNSQGKDKVIFSRILNPEINIQKEDFPIVQIKEDYLIGFLGGPTEYKDCYYTSLEKLNEKKLDWKPLFKKEEKVTPNYFVKGMNIFFMVNNKEILIQSLNDNENSKKKLVVTTKKEEYLNNILPTKEGFYYSTLKNGIEAKLYFYNGKKSKEIILPFKAGDVSLENIDATKSELWVYCSGWTQRTKIFKYDLKTNTFTEEKINEENTKYNDLVVEELEIKTHDGLLMPVSIIRQKNIKKDKKTRTIIDSYGAYGSIGAPTYSENMLEWVYNGGMYVYAHVRGGGEKGDDWHKGGYKQTKPNSWKDLISCAEYLIQKKYTSPKHLGVLGVSAGGITVGRGITERPDLFKAAVIKVGILNPLRLETTPNGANNVKEFGTTKIEEEFKALYKMDPYLHLQPNTNYPATLLTAGMNDARVLYWQPAKFVAKMQVCQKNNNPVLFRVNMDGGHGSGVTVNKSLEENIDVYTFFYWQLGHPDFQVKK
ncbi:prolyl oligopeptidase family serine peptidase [Flavobacterium davisii]|uniref:prolyl oligopeptidase family serine peptidase n=1 Tax=Flavobacterium davisii TaxID=2906077 RepID=UPI0035D0475E